MGAAKKLKLSKEKVADEAKYLREVLANVGMVYGVVMHISTSGMRRSIKLLVAKEPRATDTDGKPWIANISYKVAAVLGYAYDEDRGAVSIDGSGMDMLAAIVMHLSRWMYPNGGHIRLDTTMDFEKRGEYVIGYHCH